MNEKITQQIQTILTPDELMLEWEDSDEEYPDTSLQVQKEVYRNFHQEADLWLFKLGFTPEDVKLPESLKFWHSLSSIFAHKLALTPDLEQLRENAKVPPPHDEIIDWLINAPPFPGVEYLNQERAVSFWEELNTAYRKSVNAHEGTVESLLHSLRPDLELAGRVFFHLVENKKDAASPFAFLATYSTRMGKGGDTRHLPLKNSLAEYKGNKPQLLDLLSTVYKAAKRSELITELLESGRIFHPLSFDQETALTFLKETPLYEQAGVKCRIPNWWTARTSRVSMSLNIGDKKPSALGLKALVECSPKIMVGGEEISYDEARSLLEETSGLVLIKNKWVEVDKDRLEKTLDVYEKAARLVEDGLTMRDAMKLLLRPEESLGELGDGAEVGFGEWMAETVRKLANPSLIRHVEPDERFQANLRHYQQQGVNWLALLDSLGFGACLADDMGLGKTIETLAFLSNLKQRSVPPSLLVLPASLIGNWCDEIEKYLPDLKTLLYHGSAISAKDRNEVDIGLFDEYDLVITTYGLVHREDKLLEYTWHYVILDEAQAIKNPATFQTRAVKKLECHNRIVLTGTPVENRLSDLWSIFDFLNPGLLGSRKEFKEMVKNIQDSKDGYARLRKVVSPYILRRLKTDKSIIDDLPEKVEMKSYGKSSVNPVQILILCGNARNRDRYRDRDRPLCFYTQLSSLGPDNPCRRVG